MLDDHASSPDPQPSDGIEREGPEGETAGHRVRVLLPLPLLEALDYLIPEDTSAPEAGSFVRVTLGQRSLVGVVWDGTGGELPLARLKPIRETLPAPRLRAELRRFVERVAAYTMAPPGSVLRMTMSVPEALQSTRPRRLCVLSSAGLVVLADSAAGKNLTQTRRRVLGALRDNYALPVAELARVAACSAGVVRDLLAAGLVEEYLAPTDPADIALPPTDREKAWDRASASPARSPRDR